MIGAPGLWKNFCGTKIFEFWGWMWCTKEEMYRNMGLLKKWSMKRVDIMAEMDSRGQITPSHILDQVYWSRIEGVIKETSVTHKVWS